jgi:threonine/homoserine/homoserine lactone efflux protein
MPSLEMLLVFLGAALALNLTPGPDMLYIAARSTGEGRAAGVVSAVGISLGILVHLAALALGLSALLAAVPLAYDAVRFAGAAYLVFLGLRLVFRPRPPGEVATVAPSRLRAVFLQGVITNVLNPKVALFFLAFLPQFVDPVAPPVPQIIFLGLLFNAQGTLVNLSVAVLASRSTAWIRLGERRASLLQRVTGVAFLALGARLAVSGNR